ncbi:MULTISPECIES: DM13 domain-containing protein [unclassified Micromonospora]|uniref:DM13 domain-containing protein n=1 Tax=unclassified Micromonospora TaxID=2617518 RepID=UPI00188E4C52|nr:MULTISPECIES: DM13 domain-containing protein [unclassified Micromonospora]MBF5029848.1 DM13 domain-containing protein [Micromonospora sp. ANENR4]MCZ7474819.1 DM13 domain-containing protein [Micromonospora sp. WMMC273]WBC05445.1 DM13 domain-containing protein [Micromonospora sp. WMMA1976]
MGRRRVVLSVLAVAAVTGLGVSLYLFQPWRLVTDREVREALPTVAEPQPAGTTGSPAAGPSPTGAPPADVVLAAGDFVTHEHDTSGRAQLVRLADGRRQLLLRGLDTSDGPDLRVWLTDRKVLPGRAGWQVFDDGRWVELGRLKGNIGDQAYDIPASVDLDGLRSVSIWCKRFAVSFGAAPLAAVTGSAPA